MMLAQPVDDAVFQYRCLPVSTVTLAMNNAHAADLLIPAGADELHQFLASDGGSHAMHVEFGAHRQLAAPQLLQFALLDARAGEQQCFIRRDFAGLEII